MTFDDEETEKKSPPKDPKAELLKKLKIGGIAAAVIIVFVLIFMSATNKPQGHMMFGICRTFVEVQTTYPPTLHVTEVEQYQRAVRIYYTYTDAFGTQKSEFIECAFESVPGKGAQLTAILLNRTEIDQETIKEFNDTISAIVAGEPDLTLPRPFGKNLEDLKR
ncbi:MAG: hypothetical protein AAF569_01190 [Pseudomonadota bacterium]